MSEFFISESFVSMAFSSFIYGLSFIFLFVFGLKFLQFHRANIKVAEVMSGLQNVLNRNHFNEAIALCDNTPGPVARVVLSAMLVYANKESKESGETKHLNSEAQSAVLSQINLEVRNLERLMNVFPALAITANLLGFLSALYGFWKYHEDLDFQTLKGGFETSFVSLFWGIVLAILCSLTYYYFLNWIQRYCNDMENAIVKFFAIMDEDSQASLDVEGKKCPVLVRTRLRHLSFLFQAFPFFALIVSGIFLYLMLQNSQSVQGVTVSQQLVTLENGLERMSVPSDSIITVLGKDTYVFRDKTYVDDRNSGQKFRKILEDNKIGDSKKIVFVMKQNSDLDIQDVMNLIDLAKHFKKDAFIVADRKKVKSSKSDNLNRE